jgi:hypothetical protein
VKWEDSELQSFPPYREKRYTCFNLSKLHNRNFQEEISTGKMMYSGWAVDRIEPVGDIPSGDVQFDGIPFRIAAGSGPSGKNCIALRSVKSPYEFVPTPYIQDKAVIPAPGYFSHLHFLHALSYNWTSKDLGRYVIRYEDGSEEAVPLRTGINIEAWPMTPPRILRYAKPVWRGIVPGPEEATLYLFTWPNPFPEKKIKEVEFSMKESTAIPILIALTGKEIEIDKE